MTRPHNIREVFLFFVFFISDREILYRLYSIDRLQNQGFLGHLLG